MKAKHLGASADPGASLGGTLDRAPLGGDGSEAPLALLVRLLWPSPPAPGTLLSGFVRLPPLVAVLQLADDFLHRDPDWLGRRKRRGLVARHRLRWRRRHALGGRRDGSGTEEQPRAQGPQDEAGSQGSQQSPRRTTSQGCLTIWRPWKPGDLSRLSLPSIRLMLHSIGVR